MKYILKKFDEKPFIYSKNNIVVEVNNEFRRITGYFERDIIGKSLNEISKILKIDSQIYLENIKDQYNCYMFTKDHEPIDITIYCKNMECENGKVYSIKENPKSFINEKFDLVKQLYTDSKTGCAIFSVPDLILLKASDNFLNCLDEQYNKIESSVGKKIKKIITGFEGSEEEKVWNSVIATGKSHYVEEFQFDYYNRGITYWNSSIIPIFIEGKLKYIINKILDVTEKVLNAKLLYEQNKVIKEQKEELEAIIENISEGLVIFDKDGNIKNINSSAINYSFNCEEIRKIDDYFKNVGIFDMEGNLISKENSPFLRIINGENLSRYQVLIETNNKSTYIELSGNAIYDCRGDFSIGIILVRNVTDKIKRDETLLLKTQYNAISTIIENLDLRCEIASYPDLNINYINNKSYMALMKINPKADLISIVGKSLFDVFGYNTSEKTEVESNIKSLIEKKSNSYSYYKKCIEAEEEKFLKIICQPIFGLNNEVIEVIFCGVDITNEVEAKNKMEETLKAQDEIFSNISHELKTPLNVIFSTNQLMEYYLKNDSIESNNKKFYKGVNIIKQNCYRFTKLVNNIIDSSKIESGFLNLNLSNENIITIIEDIVESVSDFIKVKELNIVFDTNTEEKIIACDPDKIERIILNLISNAIKFTDASGSIFVNVLDKGDTVEIYVKDTGIGMDEKDLDNIFKRFHQIDKSLSRNSEGSGIGLSLVKSIVELHGGKISVESKQYEGSIFKIELKARTIDGKKVIKKSKSMNGKIEMINVEFSDIYSIY